MKQALKQILERSGWLYKIQYHPFYREKKMPGYRKKISNLVQFYQALFAGKDPGFIYDIGSNVGDYAEVYTKLGAKLLCVEPDKKNVAILRSRFGSNAAVTILQHAVSFEPGTASFYMEAEGSPVNTLSQKWVDVLHNTEESRFKQGHQFNKSTEVKTVTLAGLFEQYGMPGYLKVDVEGYEKQVFMTLNRVVPFISFECNLPEFKEETLWIIHHLHALNNQVRFNFVKAANFLLAENVNAQTLASIVESGEHRFMEIYAIN